MSAVKLYTIAYYDDDPYGGYFSGDVIDIFYDPATDTNVNDPYTGLSVYLNEVLITSGVDIVPSYVNPKVYNQTIYNTVVCKDDFKVTLSHLVFSFPYAYKISFVSNSCIIGGD